MKIPPALLINRTCHSHQRFLASKCDEGSPSWDPADAASHMVTAEELGECKKQSEQGNRVSPRQLRCIRNQCSEPRGLHLPIQRMPNSLTWCLIFDAQTACSLCCKLVCSLTPPLAFLEQFSQSYQDVVSQAWSCKHSHQVKWLSTFRSWLYFLVEQLTSLESLWMLNAQQHSSSWCCYRK